jgi:predicted restriction endonuclease
MRYDINNPDRYNHHVLFDHGGVGFGEDLSLIGAEGRLTVQPRHHISQEHLRYRREHYRAII